MGSLAATESIHTRRDHTTNSNISNYVSTKKVFRIISLLIVMSTETVEPTWSIHKVGRNTIDKRNRERRTGQSRR